MICHGQCLLWTPGDFPLDPSYTIKVIMRPSNFYFQSHQIPAAACSSASGGEEPILVPRLSKSAQSHYFRGCHSSTLTTRTHGFGNPFSKPDVATLFCGGAYLSPAKNKASHMAFNSNHTCCTKKFSILRKCQ